MPHINQVRDEGCNGTVAVEEDQGIAVGFNKAEQPLVVGPAPCAVQRGTQERPILHAQVIFEMDDVDVRAYRLGISGKAKDIGVCQSVHQDSCELRVDHEIHQELLPTPQPLAGLEDVSPEEAHPRVVGLLSQRSGRLGKLFVSLVQMVRCVVGANGIQVGVDLLYTGPPANGRWTESK